MGHTRILGFPFSFDYANNVPAFEANITFGDCTSPVHFGQYKTGADLEVLQEGAWGRF